MPESRVILDLTVALCAAFVGGYLAHRLKLPVILGYLLVGVIIGPTTPGFDAQLQTVQTLAELGVAFLMFSLGVDFHLKDLSTMRRVAIGGSVAQLLLTTAAGAGVALALGQSWRVALVFGMLGALSSSIVALKLLLLKGETSTRHGRVTLAIAVGQDLALVPILVIMPVLADEGGAVLPRLASSLGVAIAVLIGVVVLGTRLVPLALERVAATASRELFLLVVVAIALGTAVVTEHAGLSLALGAFLAGIVISETDFDYQVLADVIPLRDVFATLFFVSIGMLLDLHFLREHLLLVLGIVALLVLGKFAITAGVVRGFGVPNGPALLTGLLLAQIGELSFIVASEGLNAHILSPDNYSLIVAATVGSILVSSLVFSAGPQLAALAERLPWSGQSHGDLQGLEMPPLARHCVIGGYGRLGRELAGALTRRGLSCVVIDTDPDAVRRAMDDGLPAIYGDIGNPEVLRRTDLQRARVLALALSDPVANERAVKFGRQSGARLRIVVRATNQGQLAKLRELGANEVVQPEFEAGMAMIQHVMHEYGIEGLQIAALVSGRRSAYYRDGTARTTTAPSAQSGA
jgi:CPA2 family monovalent cation:H+ antiporter-2